MAYGSSTDLVAAIFGVASNLAGDLERRFRGVRVCVRRLQANFQNAGDFANITVAGLLRLVNKQDLRTSFKYTHRRIWHLKNFQYIVCNMSTSTYGPHGEPAYAVTFVGASSACSKAAWYSTGK